MYSLSSLNAARRHRHRHHNRDEAGETKSSPQSKKAQLTHFAGQKVVGGAIAGLLGYVDSYSGEPTFFSTKGDPTSGIGLKASLALLFNLGQLAQIGFDKHFSKKMGTLGGFIDGGIAGAADASAFAWLYVQGNTYGAAKKANEVKTSGFDYSGSPRQLPAPSVSGAMPGGVNPVAKAAQAVHASGLAGYI